MNDADAFMVASAVAMAALSVGFALFVVTLSQRLGWNWIAVTSLVQCVIGTTPLVVLAVAPHWPWWTPAVCGLAGLSIGLTVLAARRHTIHKERRP